MSEILTEEQQKERKQVISEYMGNLARKANAKRDRAFYVKLSKAGVLARKLKRKENLDNLTAV